MTGSDSLQAEIRSSAACTRSGIAALLVCIFAVSLYPPLSREKAESALGQYFGHRLSIKTFLELLHEDPCWKTLREHETGIESSSDWNLEKLLEYRCKTTSRRSSKRKVVEPPSDLQAAVPSTNESSSPANGRPATPTVMMLEDVDRPLQGLQYIAEPLQKLVNDDILDLARKASFAFDHSIFKWQLFRDRLGLFDKDAWAKITLAELRTLSEYEFPTINPRTATESSGHEIAVDPKETKTGLTTATLMTQAILIILAAYFWVFQREAMLCDSFPAPGTVFRVFSRTVCSKVLFVILTFTPAIVSGILAWYPRSTPYVQSVSIVLASCSVMLSGLIVYIFLSHKRKYNHATWSIDDDDLFT